MSKENKIVLFVHYLILAAAIWFTFAWVMTTPEYIFSQLELFIILLFVIIIVDSMEHYVMKEIGWD